LLVNPQQRILSKRGSAVADSRTNQVFVQDVGSRLDDVRRLLGKVDVPVRQVLIEARIVEANDAFSKNLGVRLGVHDLGGNNRLLGSNYLRVDVGGGLGDVGGHAGGGAQGGTPVFIPDSLSVNMPANGIGGFNPGQFSVILFNQYLTKFLNLELSALEADGKGKIISSPRVMTANNVEALIEQGTELPYQQATSSGATSVSFRKANLALKVKPQITPDGNIIMNLDVNKDSVGQVTSAGLAIDTKHVQTQVLIENGGTVVIGGIYTQNVQSTVTKVPLFGDIPLLGFFFRNNQRIDNKTELLVFITPRILEDRLGQR
jgi:type IV pilus assembly protein PilQ